MCGRTCSCTRADEAFYAAAALNAVPLAAAAHTATSASAAPTTAAPAATTPAATGPAVAARAAATAAAAPATLGWDDGRRCSFEACVSVEVTDGSAHNTLYASGAQATPHHNAVQCSARTFTMRMRIMHRCKPA